MALSALLDQQRGGNLLQSIAHPQVVNPLAAMQAGQQAASTTWDLRAKQAENAIGNALAQATDPKTGVVDYPTFQRIAASDPTTAPALRAGLTTASQLTTEQLNQHLTRTGNLHRRMGQLLADYPNGVPQDAVSKAIDDAVATGDLTPEEAAAARPTFGANPINNSRTILQGVFANLSTQEALTAARPATKTEDLGPSIAGTQTTPVGASVAPQGAVTTSGPGIAKGLSPADAAQPVHYTDENQVEQHTNVANYNAKIISGEIKPGTPVFYEGTQIPVPSSVIAQPTTGGAPKPTSISGPKPEVGASVAQYTQARSDAANYQQRIFPLVQALQLLNKPGVTTGESSDAVRGIVSHLQTLGTIFTGDDLQSIAQGDIEKLKKYLTQATMGLPGASRSDQALAEAISGTPGMHISTMANKDVATAMLALERSKMAMLADFEDQGLPSAKFADFARTWQNTHDPRFFALDNMSDAKAHAMLDKLKHNPAELKAWMNTQTLVRNHPELMTTSAMP